MKYFVIALNSIRSELTIVDSKEKGKKPLLYHSYELRGIYEKLKEAQFIADKLRKNGRRVVVASSNDPYIEIKDNNVGAYLNYIDKQRRNRNEHKRN